MNPVLVLEKLTNWEYVFKEAGSFISLTEYQDLIAKCKIVLPIRPPQ